MFGLVVDLDLILDLDHRDIGESLHHGGARVPQTSISWPNMSRP